VAEPQITTADNWRVSRLALLKKEKELTQLKDEVAQARRELPWVEVHELYRFTDANGSYTLPDLFGSKSQLVVYHFMFGADWQEGCNSCSLWADNFERLDCHLAARDIAFVAISSAQSEKLEHFKKRMGWTFRWLSCAGSTFNHDLSVTFEKKENQPNMISYNYREQPWFTEELPGVSVFVKNDEGQVFHTYSTYSRGLDILNSAYNFIDLTPKGRDEDGKAMYWVKLRDQYD